MSRAANKLPTKALQSCSPTTRIATAMPGSSACDNEPTLSADLRRTTKALAELDLGPLSEQLSRNAVVVTEDNLTDTAPLGEIRERAPGTACGRTSACGKRAFRTHRIVSAAPERLNPLPHRAEFHASSGP